jgi:hypothetical protein
MAIGAMAICRDAGLPVGRDLSVVGHGNIETEAFSGTPLTTIEHRVSDNGRLIGQLLLARLAGPTDAVWHHLEPAGLVPRASDGPPARCAAGLHGVRSDSVRAGRLPSLSAATSLSRAVASVWDGHPAPFRCMTARWTAQWPYAPTLRAVRIGAMALFGACSGPTVRSRWHSITRTAVIWRPPIVATMTEADWAQSPQGTNTRARGKTSMAASRGTRRCAPMRVPAPSPSSGRSGRLVWSGWLSRFQVLVIPLRQRLDKATLFGGEVGAGVPTPTAYHARQ